LMSRSNQSSLVLTISGETVWLSILM
jgi:hypothetical protein